MDSISASELTLLVEKSEGLCVSIFMPTHRKSVETLQNPIRFKNLIQQAETQLSSADLSNQAIKEFLKPLLELDQHDFWQHQSDGLAIFLGQDFLRYYRLPIELEELVVVSDRFHLKPLLQLLTGDGQFYLLALSQNQVRLFQGSRYRVSEIELEDMPTSLAEALRYDDPEKSLQFHTGTPQSGIGNSPQGNASQDRAAIFHGHGAGEDDQKDNILRYFRQVNKGLQELLNERRSPLILAGVEYLFPIYKEANTHPNLLDGGVSGNPEHLKPEELHEQAWQIVEPYFTESQQEDVARYQSLAGTGKTVNDVQAAVHAAYYQRVDCLFVPVGQQTWGAFDPDTSQVQMHPEQEPGDADLLDFAAMHTLLNGGKVYATTPDQIPGEAAIAAVLRY